MKIRLIFAMLLLFCLPLCGCRPQEKNLLAYQAGDFSFLCDFRVGGSTYSANLSKKNGVQTLAFTAPPALAGATFQRDDGGITASLDGMTLPLAQGDAVFRIFRLFEIPADAATTGAEVVGDENLVYISCEEGKFALTFSGGDPFPCALAAEFSDGESLSLVRRT